MPYQHLLVAVDNTEDRAPLLTKAKALASSFGARLSVVSAMAPTPINTFAGDVGGMLPLVVEPQWSNELRDELRKNLCAACAPHGIDDANIHLVLGIADSAILDTAKELGADLIVIGHRQHHGLFSNVFAHTDENVVGKAVCDVLAVVLA